MVLTGWLLNALSMLGLGGLAWFFGRSLAAGRVPLIERIARVSLPDMPAGLGRYVRGLTSLWCAYFMIAALVLAWLRPSPGVGGSLTWVCSLVLLVVEYWLRPLLFPHLRFPGLFQQLRDTWAVWRSGA